MLNPFAVYMSYGQVQGWAAQKVLYFDAEAAMFPSVAVDYVAFPYETYPYNLLRGEPPWSFSVIEDKSDLWRNQYPYFENAIISVVRVSDDASLVITDRYTDIQGAGVPNVLSWQVEGWEYDTLYEVEINNVASARDSATKKAAALKLFQHRHHKRAKIPRNHSSEPALSSLPKRTP